MWTGEVGKVTQYNSRERSGIINGRISFDAAVCQEGFLPIRGDWVTVELDMPSSPQDGGDNEDTKDYRLVLNESTNPLV